MKKILFLVTACKSRGPIQQTLNIIKNLDRSIFEPHLVTIYPEEKDSHLDEYLLYVKHHYVPIGKIDILLNRTSKLRRVLEEINPDVIHSLGVFPDFAVSRMKRWKQVITLRNYIYEDFPAKFGKLKGGMLAQIHLYAMQHTAKTVTCSESLARIYKEKLGLSFDFIRNGVDVEQYSKSTLEEKTKIRKELNIPQRAFVYVYTGQMIERKNVSFLLDTFAENIKSPNAYLLLLGDGPLLESYKVKYGSIENIDFRGNVSNVNHYLKACDAYVSTSTSEGLPNGVLEAMATGLPVVLSDIVQHLEIFEANKEIGRLYRQGDMKDLVKQLLLVEKEAESFGKMAYKSAHENFSAKGMSKKYQKIYNSI